MNELNISIEATTSYPSNWISAKEAREAANSNSNINFLKLMAEIMEAITQQSADGGLNISIPISGRYRSAVYQHAKTSLEALGYTVKGDTAESGYIRTWYISW